MAMAMEIVGSARAIVPEIRPARVVRVDDDIGGHPTAARFDTLAIAGHISPAGVMSANPVRFRSCPATVMPLRGTSQVACATPNERNPRRKGSSCGAAAEPPPSAHAEVSHVQKG